MGTATGSAAATGTGSGSGSGTNGRRDTLLLYFLDLNGDQTLTKKLEKGSFLLPAPDAEGSPFVVLRPSMLSRLFRT